MAAYVPYIVGGYAASQGAKAGKRAAGQMAELSKPYTELTKVTLPKLRNFILTQMGPEVNRPSPFMRAGHERNLADITKQGTTALRTSTAYWTGKGNVGRSRGESLRIGRATTEATGRENVGYGLQEETRHTEASTRFVNAMNMLAGLGTQGLPTAVGAIQTKAAAQQGFWSDIGGMAGDIGGQTQARQQQDWLMNMLDKYPSLRGAVTLPPSPTAMPTGGWLNKAGQVPTLDYYLAQQRRPGRI